MKSLLAHLALPFGLAVALACAGCPGPTLVVQQYSGPVRASETVAILRVNGADTVRLMTLDGEDVAVPIAPDTRLHIEMLPGKHRVSAASARDPYARTVPLVFVGEPGRVYRVEIGNVDPERGDFSARVIEVDRASDAPVRDATLPTVRSRAPEAATQPAPLDAGPEREASAPPPSMCVEAADGGAPCEAGAPRL